MFSATVKEILFFSGVWGGFAGSVPWDTTGESSQLWFSLFIYSCCVLCPFHWRLCIPHANRRRALFHLLGPVGVHLVGFWVIPQRLWSIHWAQSWSQDAMPSQQCRNRGENVAFPRGWALCWAQGLALCTGTAAQFWYFFLLYLSEGSWDRSNLGLFVSGGRTRPW